MSADGQIDRDSDPPGPGPDTGPPADLGGGSLLRSIAAVVAGFALLAVGVMVATNLAVRLMLPSPDSGPTPAYLVVNLAYSAALAVIAGYVTAKAAPYAPRAHALALAGLLLILGLAAIIGTTASGAAAANQPEWYPYTILVLGPVGATVGGRLRATSAAKGS